MFNQLGPLEVLCDAPPYHFVQACNRIGFSNPEDVRWCRISQHFGAPTGWRQLMQISPWNVLTGNRQVPQKVCVCGQGLPQLEAYTFTLITGKDVSYFLGQCKRCHTIFWDNA
jgi:hypothetical protein